MMEIKLNLESAGVLLHCLGYAEGCVSLAEQKSGEALVIHENVKLIRGQICQGIASEIISSTALRQGH